MMTDKKKVLNAIECHLLADCKSCPYDDLPGFDCERRLFADVMELLKEQKAREPHYTTLEYLVNGTIVIIHHPECPRCIEKGLVLWDAEIEKGQAYCKRCGQEIKWND